LIPVKKANTVWTFDCKAPSPQDAFQGRHRGLKYLALFEIFENLDAGGRLTYGKIPSSHLQVATLELRQAKRHLAYGRPREVKSLPKSLVAKSLGSVYNIFTISTYDKESPIAVVLDCLRKNFTSPHVLHNKVYFFT